MLLIDGAAGEGGGQIIRSALALAAITNLPVTIDNVRANRQPPGLKRQHLAAVLAAARVCQAQVEGAALGARRLVFRPQALAPGAHHFDIGSAGSATLVLQTVLPPLLLASAPSTVVVTGGTHNTFAPPFDFLERALVPLLHRLGARVTVELARHGFFPAGGGQIRAHIEPVDDTFPFLDFDLRQRGKPRAQRVRALVANLPRHVAERECAAAARHLQWRGKDTRVEEVEANGPGNVVVIETEFDHVTEVFTGFGERGVPAEQVATRAAKEAKNYLGHTAPVGEHLADQLLLPLALAALAGRRGAFTTSPLTEHSRTQIAVIGQFLPVVIDAADTPEGAVRVEVRGA